MSDHPSEMNRFFTRSLSLSLDTPMTPTSRFDPTLYRSENASGTSSAAKKIRLTVKAAT